MAPLCVLGAPLSPVSVTARQWDEESVQRGTMNVGTVRVSKSVCRGRRVCCGCGFVFPQKVEWGHLGVTP